MMMLQGEIELTLGTLYRSRLSISLKDLGPTARTQITNFTAEALARYYESKVSPSARTRLNHRNLSIPLRVTALLPSLRPTTLVFVVWSYLFP